MLPEPLLTSPDVAKDVELAESVSIAMLTILETLGPAERAVFVLREVFDTPYDEIAALDKSPSAVRQIAHRAREYVAARRPRMDVSMTEQQAVVERFLTAISTGDVQGLLDVLAPDVVLVADGGGGLAAAFRHPVAGVDRVARLLARLATVAPGAHAETRWLNGAPAVRVDLDGQLDTAVSLVIDDGRVTRIYAVRNPQKLALLDEPAPLSR